MPALTDDKQDLILKTVNQLALVNEHLVAASELLTRAGGQLSLPGCSGAPRLTIIINQVTALRKALRAAADPDNWS